MVLLVIDIQKGITDNRLYDFEGFINNTKRIIAAAREHNVEVIYVQHDDGPGTGFSVGDEAFEIADQVAPEKTNRVNWILLACYLYFIVLFRVLLSLAEGVMA